MDLNSASNLQGWDIPYGKSSVILFANKSSQNTGLRLKGLMMSEMSENTTSNTSMSSVVGFPARISALLERVQGWLESALVCGQNTSESSARFDRDSSSWRTWLPSGSAASTSCLAILPKQGMMRSGFLYGLPMLEPHTDGKGCSSWPTPRSFEMTLETAPRTSEALKEAKKKGGCRNLREEVLWGTPRASCGAGNAQKRADKGMLEGQVAIQANRETCPSLNPAWEEQLMGFPDGWTDGLVVPVKNKKIGKHHASSKEKSTTKPTA